MVIGFDIDHTITNPTEIEKQLTLKFLQSHNLPTEMVAPNEFGYFCKYGRSKKESDAYWLEICEDVLKYADIRDNAREILLKLKAEGHKIIFITARGCYDLININPYVLTYNWFKKYGIVYDKLICRDDSKVENCIKYNVDIFIDDNINVIKKLSDAGVNSILIETSHNKHLNKMLPNNCCYAKNLKQVFEIINNMQKEQENERAI